MSKGFDPKDAYFKRAKSEGYRARSAFKLSEILSSQPLIRKGWTVLDLGAAPGGFLQVLAEKVGPRGHVVGVDLKKIDGLSHAGTVTLVGDVEDDSLVDELKRLHSQYDAVFSDMAPATTGSMATDAARSHRLVERALYISSKVLRPGGVFVAKAFMGPGFDEMVQDIRRSFASVKIARPKATRSRSKECFLVGKSYRPLALEDSV